MYDLSAEIFHDENAARNFIEAQRWPDGPYCPHCGEAEDVHRLRGQAHRAGLLYCRSCRRQFSVTVGTVFERSHVPLHKWVLAAHLIGASKKGVSAHQLHRMLGVTYRTAWFMAHRIREAMREPDSGGRLGGAGGIVEVDETYIGGKISNNKRKPYQGRGTVGKIAVMALIERGGQARSLVMASGKRRDMQALVRENVEDTAHIMTDGHAAYKGLGKHFASHESVDHAYEYVRGIVHTNFAESYFSLLKRGIMGSFHHVSEKHLPRYLHEFAFRWNNRHVSDQARARLALRGIAGKRLLYRRTHWAA